jgi:hypothetical protein
MVSPILIKKPKGMRFYWNVDANVGANSPNRDEDVHLIQFGYFLMSKAASQPPNLRAIFALVRPGTSCTGREDDPLVRAIRAHQANRGGTQDGHVSVVPTSAGVYPDATGGHTYMLISIINNMFDAMPQDFPRIDKHASCPGALKGVIAEKCKL